jgi:hypothetical protein
MDGRGIEKATLNLTNPRSTASIWKIFKKIYFFLIFDSLIKNKLKNTFQYLIIS